MADVWILAEAQGGALRRVSHELVSAARAVAGADRVCAVLLGHGVALLAGGLGADVVYVLDDASLGAYSPDGWAKRSPRLARAMRPRVILGFLEHGLAAGTSRRGSPRCSAPAWP
ncbi:MAG: hypothetical protein U0470_09630 [Anaerolineae bacterium]